MYKKCMCFLVVLSSLVSSTITYASTLDDIRALYGMLRSDSDKFKAEYEIVTQGYNRIEASNKEAEFIKATNLEELYKNDYEQSVKLYEDKKLELTSSINDIAPVQSVFNIYRQVNELKISSEEALAKLNNLDIIYEVENNFADSKAYVDYIKNSENDKNDYGYIGEYTPYPVEITEENLVIPYGDYYGTDSNSIRIKLNSLQSVVNVLNGKISSISNLEDGKYVVKVNSGNCIELTYSGLDSVDCAVDDEVKQRKSLGTASDYLEFTVNVDGILVNPLSLYKERGQKIYDRYLELNSGAVSNPATIIFADMNDLKADENKDSESDSKSDGNYYSIDDLGLISEDILEQYKGETKASTETDKKSSRTVSIGG